MQFAALGIAVLSGLILILLPAWLLIGRANGGLRRATGAYFLLIGTGFMFVEIAVMQRLVLLLGDPVHAFAVTLAAFLAFAGLGSGVARGLGAVRAHADCPLRLRPALVLLCIPGLAALYAATAPWLFTPESGLGPALHALLAVMMIAPLAFAMGMPFPLVLSRLRATAPALVASGGPAQRQRANHQDNEGRIYMSGMHLLLNV
jgi:hypothetical protein